MDQEKLCVSVVPIFNHLDYDFQKEIAQLSITNEYDKHTTLFNAGDQSNQLFIIHSGKVKLYSLDETGKEHVLDVLKAGDYIGETSLFLNERHHQFAETIEPSSICVLSKEDVMSVLSRYPSVSLKLIEEFAKRLDRAQNQSETIANDNSDIRLMRYLMTLSESENHRSTISLNLPKKDIAHHLGMTPETLSRTLKRLEEQHIIERLSNKKIKILDSGYVYR